MLRVAVLFISGLGDTLVPSRMMNELHSRCGSELKQIIQIVNGTHNETWTMPGYYKHIACFLQSNIDKKTILNPSSNDSSITRTWQNIQNI